MLDYTRLCLVRRNAFNVGTAVILSQLLVLRAVRDHR
jgi:hypothetical protein